jgi:hypothetical protein
MTNCKTNLSVCKSQCCKMLGFPAPYMNNDMKHYYETHGCKVERLSDRTWHIVVSVICPQLNEEGLCKLHNTDTKPKLCQDFGVKKKGYIIPEGCIYK